MLPEVCVMSSFCLKIIAAITMLIDHIGILFFPEITIFRIIGRFAFPIFAFQISIGYKETHNKHAYILRMLAFAIISQMPYYLFTSRFSSNVELNIGFTLLLSLLVLYALNEPKKILYKIICLVPVLFLCVFLKYEYYIYGIVLVTIFYYSFNNKGLLLTSYITATLVNASFKKSIFHGFTVFSIIPILFFNGKKGKDAKLFFYIFYPLHLILLYLIFEYCL